MDKLISVIVPIYNVDRYLEVCLESIINQTYKNIEIICVNDGSNDDSGKILEKYSERDSRIIIIDKQNGGLSSARNAGLKRAAGDYIGFIDSDDYISPMFYETLVDTITSEGAGIIECGVINFKDGKVLPEDRQYNDHQTIRILDGKEALICLISHKGAVQSRYAVWNKLFKNDILRDLFFPEGEVHEDYFFDAVAYLRTEKYINITTPLYYHRVRPGSIITSSVFSEKHYDKIKHIRERTAYFLNLGENELVELSLQDEYETLLEYFYLADSAGKYEDKERIYQTIESNRAEIERLKYGLLRKFEFNLFYINSGIYLKYKKIKNKMAEKRK